MLMNKITSQIDIIIYTNNLPLLFHEGDFIITTPQNVIAIIEVKSKVCKSKVGEIVEKANANGKIIWFLVIKLLLSIGLLVM